MKATIRENEMPPLKNPLAIITFKTEASIVDYWIRRLCDNPNKYIVQIEFDFVFSDAHSSEFHSIYGSLLATYQQVQGEVNSEQIMLAFFSALQGIAYSEELNKKEEEESEQH